MAFLCLRGITGSAFDHWSLPPESESRRRQMWNEFYLWFRFSTFGSCSAYIDDHVQKSDGKNQPSSSSVEPIFLERVFRIIGKSSVHPKSFLPNLSTFTMQCFSSKGHINNQHHNRYLNKTILRINVLLLLNWNGV